MGHADFFDELKFDEFRQLGHGLANTEHVADNIFGRVTQLPQLEKSTAWSGFSELVFSGLKW